MKILPVLEEYCSSMKYHSSMKIIQESSGQIYCAEHGDTRLLFGFLNDFYENILRASLHVDSLTLPYSMDFYFLKGFTENLAELREGGEISSDLICW